jgi:hypothetical protein
VFSLAAAGGLVSVLGVVAAALEVLSVALVVELLVADWLEVLGVAFAAAVLSEGLVFGGGAWDDIVLAVGDP